MCDSLSVWVHNYVILVKVKVGHILTMFTQHTTSKQYSGHFLGVLCSMLVIGWVGTLGLESVLIYIFIYLQFSFCPLRALNW